MARHLRGGHPGRTGARRCVALRQDVEHPAVQQGPARGADALVEGALDQRVGEGVPTRTVERLTDEGDRGCTLQRVQEVVGRGVGGGQQDVEVEVPADDGGERQVGCRGSPQPDDTGVDDLTDARREAGLPHVGRGHPAPRAVVAQRADLEQVAGDLADEERVAVRLLVHGAGQGDALVVHGTPGDGDHHRDHLGRLEPRQVDAPPPVEATQRAQGLHQLVGRGQFAVPERPHHGQSHGAVVGRQVAQQLHAAVVGPLQVVEDQHHGPVAGQSRQQSHHGGEQLEPLGVRVDGPHRREPRQAAGELGDECGELRAAVVDQGAQLVLRCVPYVVPERLGEELVGGAQVLLAVARQDARAVVEGPAGHARGPRPPGRRRT